MGKRFRDTSKYDKRWYMDLTPRLKCAVDFLHDKADNAGVWEPNYVLLNTAVNDRKSINEFEILTIDHGKQFLKLENGKIYCKGFIEFQYGELSEKCKPHVQILKLLTKHDIDLEKLKGIEKSQKGIHTLQEKDMDKETDKDEKGKGQDKILVHPFNSEKWFKAWDNWIKYRTEIKKPYLTEMSEQAELKALSEFTEPDAIKMIEKSIASGWQGIFELKNNNNGKSRNSTWEESDRKLKELLAAKHGNG